MLPLWTLVIYPSGLTSGNVFMADKGLESSHQGSYSDAPSQPGLGWEGRAQSNSRKVACLQNPSISKFLAVHCE
ncbi:MAG: hypothetical protein K0R86_1190 [Enterobacter kobei]|jgi:hypothetical protein|nr:hypothetical protein [Enterobacter kobei]SIR55166.1 hypothetical protein SAMN05444841_105298 [Enterobacter kobei]